MPQRKYLAQVKGQDYALRYGKSRDSSHLAVPIIHRRKVLAVMGISVFTKAVKDKIVPVYLPLLLKGAEHAAKNLSSR